MTTTRNFSTIWKEIAFVTRILQLIKVDLIIK